MVESYLESLNHLRMVFQGTQKIMRKTIDENRVITIKIKIMGSKNIIILITKRMTHLHLIILYINSNNKNLNIILIIHLFIIITIVFHWLMTSRRLIYPQSRLPYLEVARLLLITNLQIYEAANHFHLIKHKEEEWWTV